MILQDTRIRLRAMEPEDLDYIFRWENDTKTWFDGTGNNPFSNYSCRQFIENSLSDIYQDGELRLIITDLKSGEPVGCVDLSNLNIRQGRVELSLYIDPLHRRHGYASSATRVACQYVFDFLNLRMLYVQIRVTNESCMSLFRHLGFDLTATLVNWVRTIDGFSDVAIFQKFHD